MTRESTVILAIALSASMALCQTKNSHATKFMSRSLEFSPINLATGESHRTFGDRNNLLVISTQARFTIEESELKIGISRQQAIEAGRLIEKCLESFMYNQRALNYREVNTTNKTIHLLVRSMYVEGDACVIVSFADTETKEIVSERALSPSEAKRLAALLSATLK